MNISKYLTKILNTWILMNNLRNFDFSSAEYCSFLEVLPWSSLNVLLNESVNKGHERHRVK